MSEFSATENLRVKSICVKTLNDGSEVSYTVDGIMGVTKIEQCEKSGMYSNIPYLRVFVGENIIAELCQHNIESVTFFKETK
jgi:hypothetical protein